MEINRNDRIPTFSELIDAYNKDPRFYDGFRIGYACGSNDAIDQFCDLDQCETDYEDGWEDGYDEGYDEAVDDFFEDDESDEEITAEKPTDEESLLEFLDSLADILRNVHVIILYKTYGFFMVLSQISDLIIVQYIYV